MNQRPFGSTGATVSEIGFGSWAIGSMWGPTNDQTALAALERAIELGVNFFDTAQIYGDGASEKLIAKALRGWERRDSAFLCTKIPPANWEWPASCADVRDAYSKKYVMEQAEESLRNLEAGRIDLLLLHVWHDGWTEQHDWLEGFEKLREQGKVRFYGVSANDFEPGSAVRLARSGYVHAIQAVYNMFEQSPEDELLPAIRESGSAFIARCPLDEGSLTGKFTEETTFHEDDFRAQYFAGDRLKETVARVEKLKRALVPTHADDLASAALRFALSRPETSVVIPGIRTPRQAEMNCGRDMKPLSAAALEEIRKHRWTRNFYEE